MAISAANKKKWHQLVERLQQQTNLTDEEVVTIKEWGVALLVTGVSVWILYRIVRKIFGPSKKIVVEKVVRKDDPPVNDRAASHNFNEQKSKKRKSGKKSSSGSPWFPLIRRYAGPLLLALAQRQVNSYLRSKKIIP